jgi:hypothetical protein
VSLRQVTAVALYAAAATATAAAAAAVPALKLILCGLALVMRFEGQKLYLNVHAYSDRAMVRRTIARRCRRCYVQYVVATECREKQ